MMVAQRRHALHKNHSSSRPLSKNYEFIGLVGEAAMAHKYDLFLDLEDRPGGDERIDFYTNLGTLDVKTALKPFNILREAKKDHADILILAGWHSEKRCVDFYGWEREKAIVDRCPVPKDFGYGIKNHFMHRSRLNRMEYFDRVFDIREFLNDRHTA